MFDVTEINSIDQLDGVSADWDRLLVHAENISFFHTLPWLKVYWRHFGADQRLRVLVIGCRGQVVGILPLVLRREQRKVGPVRVLTWPLADWGSFYGPLGADPATLLAVGLQHVRRTSNDWDLIDLRWMDGAGPLAAATGEAMNAAGLTTYRRTRDQTPLIELTGTWDDYLASRTSKWRNNLRRWRRKFAERGTVTFERYRPGGRGVGDVDPRWDLLEECLAVAERSWQGTSQTGTTISHASIRDFIRDAHRVAAEHGCLDLNVLRLDGCAAAYAYNYVFRGQVFSLRIGYDAHLATEGVGNLLYCQVLEDSFRRGDRVYDMGPGSLDCKRYLWTKLVDLAQYIYFRPMGVRAQVLRWKGHWSGEFAAIHAARGAADRECS